MIKSLSKTPARGKPALRKNTSVEIVPPDPKIFSRIKFDTVIRDIKLLENVTYQEILDLQASLGRIDELEEHVINIENDVTNVVKPSIQNLSDTKIDKNPFMNLSGLADYTFEDSNEVTVGLCMIRDAFLDAIGNQSDDEIENTRRAIRRERAKRFAERHISSANKIKSRKNKTDTETTDETKPSEEK